MMEEIVQFAGLAAVSIWGCVYVGSLVPQLWRRQNYRGAIGVGVLAGLTLILPILLSLLQK